MDLANHQTVHPMNGLVRFVTMYRRLPLVVLVISGYLFLSACVEKTEYDALQKKFDDTTKQLSETRVRIPMMSISRSEVMAISNPK